LTNKREPAILGLEEELDSNQREHASYKQSIYGTLFIDYYSTIAQRFKLLSRDLGERLSAVEYHSNLPHVKRALRIHSLQSLKDTAQWIDSLFTARVNGKIKFPEFAKPGKYPRMIGDYTCPGSLYGGFLMDSVKEAFVDEYCAYPGHSMFFVKSPNREVLLKVFDKLIRPDEVTFVYHSDDSCAGVRCDDGYLWMNVDISSCDTSNRQPVFNWLKYLTRGTVYYEVMEGMVKQCKNPLYIANPWNRREKLKFRSTEPIEYSGSLLTTALNNVASSNIGLAFSHDIQAFRQRGGALTKAVAQQIMIQSARNVGYLVTCEVTDVVEGVQFLKNSPYITNDGGLDFFLNLGVVLRSLGSCDGDLPGKSSEPMYRRAYRHLSSVLNGYCHAGNNSVLDALRDKFPIRKDIGECDVKLWYHTAELRSVDYIPNSVLCKRYKCTDAEIGEFLFYINGCDIGTVVSCPFLEKVFAVDYGIEAG